MVFYLPRLSRPRASGLIIPFSVPAGPRSRSTDVDERVHLSFNLCVISFSAEKASLLSDSDAFFQVFRLVSPRPRSCFSFYVNVTLPAIPRVLKMKVTRVPYMHFPVPPLPPVTWFVKSRYFTMNVPWPTYVLPGVEVMHARSSEIFALFLGPVLTAPIPPLETVRPITQLSFRILK